MERKISQILERQKHAQLQSREDSMCLAAVWLDLDSGRMVLPPPCPSRSSIIKHGLLMEGGSIRRNLEKQKQPPQSPQQDYLCLVATPLTRNLDHKIYYPCYPRAPGRGGPLKSRLYYRPIMNKLEKTQREETTH